MDEKRGGLIKVFIGPSRFSGIDAFEGLRLLPPAGRGDLYTEAQLPDTRALVIIDGVFGETASVLHKEILWALAAGIPVYGASSIGAVRASELADLGMQGHGWIYEAYLRGTHVLTSPAAWNISPESSIGATAVEQMWLDNLVERSALTDDDDVALAHGPVELSYRASSEPLVNIFRSVISAPVSIETKYCALLAAKRLPFRKRGFSLMLNSLECDQTMDFRELETLTDWVSENRVDQKQLDARSLLESLERDGVHASSTRVDFIETIYWKTLRG